ncbi:hypothetical protein DPEC_G00124930 [Dallia pectoralis]|uniref:Uncharacterized protein n=1 Tax=Dallia pectoralis TaxID=75939 RepID=A0ACC2GQU0_DALPE|nr:hypothetical protein DPEC_G00124930 [Dallia pectoralis]
MEPGFVLQKRASLPDPVHAVALPRDARGNSWRTSQMPPIRLFGPVSMSPLRRGGVNNKYTQNRCRGRNAKARASRFPLAPR